VQRVIGVKIPDHRGTPDVRDDMILVLISLFGFPVNNHRLQSAVSTRHFDQRSARVRLTATPVLNKFRDHVTLGFRLFPETQREAHPRLVMYDLAA